MKKFILLILPLLLSHLIVAQPGSNAYRKLADSLVRTHNYSLAVTYYEKAMKNASKPGGVMLQIAKCHQKMNRIIDADKWYHDAKNNGANFTSQDSYDFVYILMEQQKRGEAEGVLNNLISEKPGDLYAKRILNDLLTIEKYYKDSMVYDVSSLSINTPVSEFAPAYYKEGIVFSSAQPQNATKEKSPWDNSDFLNLYQTTKTPDQQFQKPVVLEEKLDSRYHDGPAVFYGGYDRMILNRNHAAHAEGKKNTWIWHLSLYDAHYSTQSKSWQLNAMPFDEPPYSTAHPFMAEDGNTLYFVSDRPGGYGGSDIYRARKVNGVWGKPFNLGPAINSPGNEVFPFLSDNTLYFASNGHGGLGGLDIFKSVLGASGFAPPVNVGYPINSTADDFSFITKSDGENGYFASSRNGNDDLFEFHKKVEAVKMLAYIYDGKTKQPIANAKAKLMSTTDEDRALISDENGYYHFELSRETAYILIGSHEGKSGMINGFALPEEDHQHVVHQIPLFGDSNKIACIGRIQNSKGEMEEASTITIFDETTGKVIQEDKNKSIVDFKGEKGHTYRVEIRNKNGDVTTQQVTIAPDETEPKTWSMVVKDDTVMIAMAARIFNAENNQPLGGASAKVQTFLEEDIDLVANENGVVEFSLKQGTAYLLVASKDSLNGIHAEQAEITTSKTFIIHPVPLYGKPANPISIAALITDDEGQPLNNVVVTVVNKTTGQKIPVKVTNGLISFLGERGKEYDVQISAEGFKPVATSLAIPPDAKQVDEISIVLSKDSPSGEALSMTAHVFKEDDNLPLAGAAVTVLSLEADKELKADNDGNVTFTLTEGTAYIIMANRDGYSGMYSGVAEKGPGKSATIIQVATTRLNDKQVTVAGKLRNTDGTLLDEVTVTVTDKTTGERIPAQFKHGLLAFVGIKGRTYTVSVEDKNHRVQKQDITIPGDADAQENIDLVFDGVATGEVLSMTAHVFKQDDNLPLAGADVTVLSLEADKELKADKDGNVAFTLAEGTAYIIMANRDGYSGLYSGVAEKRSDKSSTVIQVSAGRLNDKQVTVAGKLTDGQGVMLDEVTVTVIDKTTGERIPAQFKHGLLAFVGIKGHTYTVSVEDKNHRTQTQDITIPGDAGSQENIDLVFDDALRAKNKEQAVTEEALSLTAHVFKQDDKLPLAGAAVTVISLGTDMELKADNVGNVSFTLPEGIAYIIMANRDGYTGMYSGIAEKGTDKSTMTIQVPTTRMNNNQVNVAGKLRNTEGMMLDEVTVTVTDKTTGERIPPRFNNGLLSFVGIKGRTYTVSVEDKNHRIQTQDVTTPTDAQESIDLVFDEATTTKSKGQSEAVTGEALSMAAHVFRQDDNRPLAGAAVTVISLGTDVELTADNDGNVPFTLPEGMAYIIMANRDGYSGMYSGIAEQGTGKPTNVVQVSTSRLNKKQVTVAGKLRNTEGMMLDEVTVIVTDKSTGERIPAQFKNGLLAFIGTKGHIYTVSVEDKNHNIQSEDIAINSDATPRQNADLTLAVQDNTMKNNDDSKRIPVVADLMESQGMMLDEVTVTITDKSTGERIPSQFKNGLLSFIAVKGNIYSVAVQEGNKPAMVEEIVIHENAVTPQRVSIPFDDGTNTNSGDATTPASNSQQVDVTARLSEGKGMITDENTVTVTDKETGANVPSTFKNGVLDFTAEKGNVYTITSEDKDHQITSQEVTIPNDASSSREISLTMNESSTVTVVDGNKAVEATMIRLHNDGAGDKFYLSTGSSNAEIKERNGNLYLNDGTGEKNLGEGTLAGLEKDPSYLKQLGLSFDEIIEIENIYFDYNKTTLDATDKGELNKAKVILQRYPHLQLTVSAHADDRGTDKYNLNLSKRRAKAVASYLAKIGVNRNGISIEAHGESVPAVPCSQGECNDAQRQKNRRAELTLRSFGHVVAARHTIKSKTRVASYPKANSSRLEDMLSRYGDKTAEGLTFKISIGAYRFNHTLTFDELKDLGTVEKVHIDGVTYYYLTSFATMRSAEAAKKEVIKRHVKDAFVSIFHDNERITFKEFLKLIGDGSQSTDPTRDNR